MLSQQGQGKAMDYFSIEYALLAMQNALLREVTPNLRAVVVDLDKDTRVLHARFYHDGEISEKMTDLWSCVNAEASASLGPDCFVDFQVERLDYPRRIPLRGRLAYLRKEDDSFDSSSALWPRIEIKEQTIGYALLAVQQALLGIVTPELRAVVVDFDKGASLLYIHFYYHGDVPERLTNLWQAAIREASLSFGSNCLLDGIVNRVDYPATFPFRGRFGYFRKEYTQDD